MKKKILIVDDSVLAIDVARTALESAGHVVLTALDLAQLEAFRADLDVDLVLMDVQMPEIYGDDIAAVLRQFDGVSVPIYLYSNLERDELERRAIEAGIDGFVSKRDGIEAVVEQVSAILEGRGE